MFGVRPTEPPSSPRKREPIAPYTAVSGIWVAACAGTTNREIRAHSPLEFDHVQAARLVGEVDEAAVVLGDVVGERRLLPVARLRDDVALLPGLGGIADVDDPQPGAEPGDVDQTVLVHPLAQLVRAETKFAPVIGRGVVRHLISIQELRLGGVGEVPRTQSRAGLGGTPAARGAG